MQPLFSAVLIALCTATPVSVSEPSGGAAYGDLPLSPANTSLAKAPVETGYVNWKRQQLVRSNQTTPLRRGKHARVPTHGTSGSLVARDYYSVYAEGMNVAIDAPGIPAEPAYLGFPSLGSGDRQSAFIDATLYSFLTPGLVPEGVNPDECTPRDGQVPVVLVPGTLETAYTNWAYMGPQLADEGLCVYTFNHNPMMLLDSDLALQSTAFLGDIGESAAALSAFVDEVLELTGAEKVDLLGHSQGAGALPYYYLKNLMEGSKVRKAIGLAPSLGTDFYGIDRLFDLLDREVWEFDLNSLVMGDGFNSASLDQQLVGSPFMQELNDGGPAIEGVEYVNIATIYDNVLMPWQNCLPELQDGKNITNIVLQDICSIDRSDHVSFPYSRNAYQIVRNHLFDIDDPISCCEESPAIGW